MASFHEVQFPMRLALATSGGPMRRTDIVSLSNGREARNRRFRHARRQYDVGSGIRSVDDLYEVLAFFEARDGELYGFRFTDPVDHRSCAPQQNISPTDQVIGTGDGVKADFQLVKAYGDQAGSSERLITKPVAGSVVVQVGGLAAPPSDFSVNSATGVLSFVQGKIPANGAVIRAGYRFDVPVRFAIDRIDISLSAFNAGRIPTIPLIEIMP